MQQVAEKLGPRAHKKRSKKKQLTHTRNPSSCWRWKISTIPQRRFSRKKKPADYLAPYLFPTLAEDFRWFFRRCQFISIKIKMAEQTFYFYRRRLPDPIFEVRIFFGKHKNDEERASILPQQQSSAAHTYTHNIEEFLRKSIARSDFFWFQHSWKTNTTAGQ